MKPSIPKGTRDFSPGEMLKRNHLFGVIRSAFEHCGYLPLETPSMENLSTLMGKYGEEGDKLIFKILDSGDFLEKADEQAWSAKDSRKFAVSVSEKALRYDLTVPFARYVVMNQHAIAFPFRRYQIQPVWRADRPQKGRYREFYQCDADVIGSGSLLCEVEMVQLIDKVFMDLGFRVMVQYNNRKILAGIAEMIGAPDQMIELTVALDKLDKIGVENVKEELVQRGFSPDALSRLEPLLTFSGDRAGKLALLDGLLADSLIGKKGLEEAKLFFGYADTLSFNSLHVELELTLARGLNYYTGAIFEVKADDPRISFTSSICGGGRYDDLTGVFGQSGLSGVGISFGADRIKDVMEEASLFPSDWAVSTQVLLVNFGDEYGAELLALSGRLRNAGIRTELYPDPVKMKKQLAYADARKIPFVLLYGEDERIGGSFQLKDMSDGSQSAFDWESLLLKLNK
jgi:histidyl-tRNA synthetase